MIHPTATKRLANTSENMKKVEIFGKKYSVTESVYTALNSVVHSDECIGWILTLGKQTGEIKEL